MDDEKRRALWSIYQEQNRNEWGRESHVSDQMMRASSWGAALLETLEKALRKHAPMNSPHEAYAVIREELDEFWDEVKKQNGGHSPEAVKEALQTAAMCLRFILDTVPPEIDGYTYAEIQK